MRRRCCQQHGLPGAGQRPEFGGYGLSLFGVHRAEGFLRPVQEGPGVGGAIGGRAQRPGPATFTPTLVKAGIRS